MAEWIIIEFMSYGITKLILKNQKNFFCLFFSSNIILYIYKQTNQGAHFWLYRLLEVLLIFQNHEMIISVKS